MVLNNEGVDNTIVSGDVTLEGVSPGATYSVALQQSPGGCPKLTPDTTSTTDTKGNGKGHFAVPRVKTATSYWVTIAKPGFSEVYGTSAVPAEGSQGEQRGLLESGPFEE